MPLRFELDPLTSPAVRNVVATHLAIMRSQSPPESVHALAIGALQAPEVKFWSAWLGPDVVGCGALVALSPDDGEIKSMHVLAAWRGRGFAAELLTHIEAEARAASLSRLWLETGSMVEFEAARKLYASFGYVECGPFGNYADDPNSTFMTKRL